MDNLISNIVLKTAPFLDFLAALFAFTIGFALLIVVIIFIHDITQSKNAILKNYPVVGHFRNIFSNLGEFFRQYFFAMDREEMPFNRAEREWVHRASNNVNNTIAFGSTKNLTPVGTLIFANCPFPTLEEEAQQTSSLTIGENYCSKPYTAKSVFNISGMSFGALSAPAVLALSNGARMAGCWYNTGEGGILPGSKVTEEIAKVRGIPVGKDSISPNRHVDVGNVQELLAMINHVRNITGKPTGFKTVIGAIQWLDDLFAEINKKGLDVAPDFITLDSGDGGTGAAPMPLMDNAGLTIKETLPLLVDKLIEYGLKERIKVIASGKLVTPSEVAWAMCVGADFINSARGFMFSLGCIQALKCNKNTCPTGITTHNTRLQKGLNPKNKQVKVANYVMNMNKAIEIIAHSCGVKEPRRLNRNHVS